MELLQRSIFSCNFFPLLWPIYELSSAIIIGTSLVSRLVESIPFSAAITKECELYFWVELHWIFICPIAYWHIKPYEMKKKYTTLATYWTFQFLSLLPLVEDNEQDLTGGMLENFIKKDGKKQWWQKVRNYLLTRIHFKRCFLELEEGKPSKRIKTTPRVYQPRAYKPNALTCQL